MHCILLTDTQIPYADEHAGPLPLHYFLNRHLNRFGRGKAAVTYFGDYIEVESFQVCYKGRRMLGCAVCLGSALPRYLSRAKLTQVHAQCVPWPWPAA